MDSNVIDLDKDSNCLDEDNSGAPTAEPTLKILKDFHNMYEERLSLVQRKGKGDTLQLQNTLLRSWVDDLVAQNSLLVQTVEELEMEAVKRIHMIEHQISAEQRKHAEIESELQSEISILRRQLGRKDSDLRGLVEVLRRLRERDPGSLNTIHFFEVTESDVFGSDRRKVRDHGDKENNELLKDGNERYRNKERGERAFRRKKRETPKDRLDKMNELKILNDTLEKENTAKDREIRRLTESLLQHEAIITSLRSQVSQATRDVTTKDANVSVCLCCTEDARCDEMEPVRDYCAMLKDETDTFDTKMAQMEMKLKSSVEVQRHLRTRNVQISEDVDWLRSVCCSLDERCRAATLCSQFKEEIIREMRRQLKQAKAKLNEQAAELRSTKGHQDSSGDPAEPPGPKSGRRRDVPKLLDNSPAPVLPRVGLEQGDTDLKPPSIARFGLDRASDGDGDKISNKSK